MGSPSLAPSFAHLFPCTASPPALHPPSHDCAVVNQTWPPLSNHQRPITFSTCHSQSQLWQRRADIVVSNDLGSLHSKEGAATILLMPSEHSGKVLEANGTPVGSFSPDSSIWNSIILANARSGQNKQAIETFLKMQSVDLGPNIDVFVTVAKACGDLANLECGQGIHAYAIETGLEMNFHVGNMLVDMYTECGSLGIAYIMFNKLPEQDISTWSGLITANIEQGNNWEALSLFHHLAQTEIAINSVLYVLAVKACTRLGAIEEGQKIHVAVVESGLESDLVLGNSLINMYARSNNNLDDAFAVLFRLPKRDVVSWNALIEGYTHAGLGHQAIHMFGMMQLDGCEPDNVSLITILKACSSVQDLEQGAAHHILIAKVGLDLDLFVCSTVLDMYMKCGSVEDGQKVFNNMLRHDSVAWGALIAGYIEQGRTKEALELFEEMQREGSHPSLYTIICLLKACSKMGAIDQGKELHSLGVKFRYECDLYFCNVLIGMYAKSGNLEDSQKVFDQTSKRDVVTWSELISGYSEHEDYDAVFRLFVEMQQENVQPNHVTFGCVLKACTNVHDIERATFIYSQIVKEGLELNPSLSNSLLRLYANCGSLMDVDRLFLRLQDPDVVSWSILMGSCNQRGLTEEAYKVFEDMKCNQMELDEAAYVCILQTCSKGVASEQIKEIHNLILNDGLELNPRVGNTIVDMYAKIGNFQDALSVFDRLPQRDVVTWNALISGYSHHGCHQQALSLFESLRQGGVEPNEVTFVCIFKSCAQTSAFNKGKQAHSLFLKRGFELDAFSGSALIDMYMSCGSLEDAQAVFKYSPKEYIAPWNALLAGYAQHNQYEHALECFSDLCSSGLQPDDVTFMCLLSACSHAGQVDQGVHHFKLMRERRIAISIEYYNLMVGLFCHAGCFQEAEEMLECLPIMSNVVGWTSLLAACRRIGNVEVGQRCFKVMNLLDGLDTIDTGYHSLMVSIYKKAGLWEDAEKVEELRKGARIWKKPAKSYIEVDDIVHEFTVADDKHPRNCEIHAKLKSLSSQMKQDGYAPELDPAFSHSEKIAIAFGLLSQPTGSTIRIVKNLRVCDDCHDAAKLISKIELREICIKDSYHVHRFSDGSCSCKDIG
ncbi:hypothetical protein GOP47_0020395 [Adiantum capillus-veneris]|uniref:DYW domain-containing protein n=1 Tax=Adiantum capillus-veneris TaxID=13818 RepID=A0A9D4UDC1_ADICA|nr:hypothetical protein GOP47_0020395 [Adiantum capillus-veneris]